MPRWLNIPNCFTVLRIVLVPFIIQSVFNERHVTALILFACAAITDSIDGAVARRFGAITRTGAYLDPIADKCLLSGVFLSLAASSILPWWFVSIIFGRDLYILLAVALILLFTPVRRFPPSVWGKLSTFIQILTAVAWMARNVFSFRLL